MTKLLVLILAIPVCVAHAQVPSPSPATSEPSTGTISGKVVNETGQPMVGAIAVVRAVNASVAGRATITDSEGNFQVSGLDPALYTVTVGAPAYTSIPADPNAPTYYRIGDSVRVELVRGGVITGTVTNADGEPVVAVNVRAVMIRDTKGQLPRLSPFGGREEPTDDRGIYRMYGLAPGTYFVFAGGFGPSQSFQFNPYTSDLPTYSPSATRDNAAEVSVRGGEESTADIRYRGEPGYTISGTVKLAGTNGAQVLLTPVGSGFMPGGNLYQPPGSRGFAFNGIGDGEYELVAQEVMSGVTNPAADMMAVSEAKRITVKGASVTGIELVPKLLGLVSGKISLEPSKVTACQGKRPPLFSETIVRLRRPEKDPETTGSAQMFFRSGTPDQNGAFVLRNLSPGKYQFDPRFFARYWYLRSMTIGTAPSKTDAAANWTTLKFGERITGLTITLAAGAASVRGKLASEQPPSGMVLYLVPSEPDKADDVLRFFVTEIGADGTFALSNLPPGKYWALTQTNADAQTATLTKLREPEAANSRTKLRKSAEAQKTAIELKPCQNLTDYQVKF